ncbi:MAG: hypothetical protein JSU72_20735, partial [Deltaproteobacteria bacterium]
RRFMDNNYLLFLGIAYLFTGGTDLLHTLAYKGMGIFRTANTNLPTQLWIAARYVESTSLLIAPIFLGRRLKSHAVVIGFAVVFVFLLGSIFYWNIFPDCFIEGRGLTQFKKLSEYFISIILLISVAFLFQKRRYFDRDVLRLLLASIILTICAELAFTFYVHAYGFSNLIGHYLKIISFYLVYKALIETGLVKPYSLLFRDLKQSGERLGETNKKLMELESLKKDLTNMIVHDMRNPVTSTMMALDVVGFSSEEPLTEQQSEFIQLAKRNQFKLSEMITNLLEISKLESGSMRVNRTSLDVGNLMSLTVDRYVPILEAAEKSVRVSVDPQAQTIISDESLLERILSNLLSNAIQHSGPRGEVLISVVPAMQQGAVSVSVRDFGEGIPMEYHGKIFEKFSQAGLRRLGQKTGTGLGLAFCKMAVEALGGTISVESEPGKGSCFTLFLPEALPATG